MADQPARARVLIAAIDEAVASLLETRQVVAAALRRAHDDVDSGLGAGGAGERVSQSPIPDRATAERALAHWRGHANQPEPLVYEPDRVAENAQRLVKAIMATRLAARIAMRSAWSLLPIAEERAAELRNEIEGGPRQCVNPNCKGDIWGRARAGRCDACYQYRLRHDGAERPRQLCHPEEVEHDGGSHGRETRVSSPRSVEPSFPTQMVHNGQREGR